MAIQIKHAFTSSKGNGADSTLVQPSNWNDNHVITMATGRLLGRASAGAGAAEEIVIGTGLALTLPSGVPTLSVGGSGSFPLTAAAGNSRLIQFLTNTLSRWTLGVNSAAESGSNAGADFVLDRYDDAGTVIGQLFKITRSTGAPSGDLIAVAGDFWNNRARILTAAGVLSAAAPQAKTFGTTITYNPQTDGFNIEFTPTASFTLANPTNVVAGMQGSIRIQQDATGSRLITYGTNWKKASATDPTLSTAANAVDYIFWYARSTTEILFNIQKAVT